MNKKSNAIRSVFFNVSSNILSQIIVVAFIPVLARLYKPEDFGIATLFLGIASCLVAISSLRISVTIPIADSVNEKSIGILISFILISLLALFLSFSVNFFEMFNSGALEGLGLVFVIYFYITAINNVLTNTVISNGNYPYIGGAKVSSSIFLNLARLLMVYFSATDGLIYSLLVAECFGFLILWLGAKDTIIKSFKVFVIDKVQFRQFLVKYKDYPKYQVFSQFILISSQYAPVFIMSSMFAANEVGLFVMANNLVNMPVNSIGIALSQIYLGEYRREKNRGKIFKHSLQMVFFFLVLSIPFVVLFVFFGHSLINILLGEQWAGISSIITLLIVLGTVKLCMSVISQSLNIFRAQKLQLGINLIFFISSYLSLGVSVFLGCDFYNTVLIYTLAGTTVLLLGVFIILLNIRVNTKNEDCISR